MNIHGIHNLSNEYVVDILKKGLIHIPEDHLKQNYSPAFSHINSNLFYILGNGRYKTGKYYVIEDNGKFIASAGWSEYTADTALVLSRAFVAKEFRTSYIMGEKLLPLMIAECTKYEHVWITCNDYNKAIYNWFYRTNKGQRAAMYSNWPAIYARFKPVGQKIVYHTDQYVAELDK